MVQSLLPVKKGFVVVRVFAFQPRRLSTERCREAVGIPGVAGNDTNNKEVPLDAR